MVSKKESQARIQDFFRFSRQEVVSLIAAVFVTSFIFSFRDWGGDTFNASVGIKNLILMLIVVIISFMVRLSAQKIKGLEEGYKADFKVWWLGLGIALVTAFITLGRVPLVLIGTMVTAFMVKQRLGEMRYGFSYEDNANIAARGVVANIGLATFFAVGLFFLPESYFFSKGMLLNLVMAICSLLPLPQLDGLSIFFGSRVNYFILLIGVIIFWVLLLSGFKIALIIAVILNIAVIIKSSLFSSEK